MYHFLNDGLEIGVLESGIVIRVRREVFNMNDPRIKLGDSVCDFMTTRVRVKARVRARAMGQFRVTFAFQVKVRVKIRVRRDLIIFQPRSNPVKSALKEGSW